MNEEIVAPLTISVPEAGRKYFGLSRNGAYNAAARGDIPTVRVGKLLRVPVRALESMLDQARHGRGDAA
jgi:Helix-turn-helix domain